MPILGHPEHSHNILSRSLGWVACSHHHFCEVVALGTQVVWSWETANPLTGLEIEGGCASLSPSGVGPRGWQV